MEVQVSLRWGLWDTHVDTLGEGPRFLSMFAWGHIAVVSPSPFSPQNRTDPCLSGAPGHCLGSWNS